MTSTEKPVALTMGEPAGIGTEIALKAWLRLRQSGRTFFILHDPDHVAEVSSVLSLDVPVRPTLVADDAVRSFRDAIPVMPVKLAAPVRMGSPDTRNASAVIGAIRIAVRLAASGDVAAVVTNPIQKSVLYESGYPYPGHTEFLEHLARPGHRATMMLASEHLKVVPVSIHEPLSAAVSGISTGRVVEVSRAADAGLRRDFGISRPRLAVAGLNPHAGEAGTMGREEIEVIAPAVKALRDEGIDARGPYPPDTMFTPRSRARYDAAICMYHDQALIPLKTLDVDGGVNVTMGLPFVRTSPDHGTALDLAGKGHADPGSLVAAIRMAIEIAAHRRNREGIED